MNLKKDYSVGIYPSRSISREMEYSFAMNSVPAYTNDSPDANYKKHDRKEVAYDDNMGH